MPFDPGYLKRVIYSSIERNRLQQSLRALSFTDEMTGLYNRRGLFTLLEQQLSLSKRSGQGFFLFVIDLDYLKTINDTFGHPVGDKALMDVADSLHLAFRHDDIIGRIGGDEFAVIALNVTAERKEYLKLNIDNEIKELNKKTLEPYQLSLSVGAAYYNGRDKITIDELMQKSDLDLYEAKRASHLRGNQSTIRRP